MKINKQIKNECFTHKVKIKKAGLCAIFISARCKSKKQINSNIDEDLRVEINGLEFREIPPVKNKQLFNIPSAFNGSRLKGLKKTVVFLSILNKGEHAVNLIPRNSAFVEEIKVKELSGQQEVKLEINEQAEDGDRRPWYAFVLIDLPLKKLSADITAKWRGLEKDNSDSDDVKLIINNKIKTNNLSIFHRNWLWSANIFKKIFQKQRQIKAFKQDLTPGIHYIEFYADKMPTLHWVKMDLGEIEMEPEEQTEKAKIVSKQANLRSKPEITNNIIATLSNGEKIIVLEKAVKGERPRNSKGVLLSSNRWHKVQYNNIKGYIYSEGMEIIGEEKVEIQKMIIQKARDLDLEPEIVLALADCESRFFPYTVSYDDERPEIAFGVMQLTKDLITDLNNNKKSFYSPIKELFNIEQNIQAGIKYFQYLHDKYKDDKDGLAKTIAAYNSGPGNVSVNKPFNLNVYESQTKRLVNCAQKHIQQKTFKKILIIGLIFFIGLFAYEEFIGPGAEFLIQAQIVSSVKNKEIIGHAFEINSLNPEESLFQLKDDLDNNKKIDIINFKSYFKAYGRHTEMQFNNQVLNSDGYFTEAYAKDINKDNIKEVIVSFSVGANGVATHVYRFQDNAMEYIPIKPDFLPKGFFGGMLFVDYDDDGDLEVRVDQRVYPPDPCKRTADIYEYIDNQFILTEQIQTYEPTCQEAIAEFKG